MKPQKRKRSRTFWFVRSQSPQLIQYMLLDLLEKTNYDEVDIGFCAGIDLDKLRAIPRGKVESLTRKDFEGLFLLYSRIFCNSR